MCGRCCRDMWGLGVDDACRRRLAGSDLLQRLRAVGPVLVRGGAGWRAAVREGHCVFLDERGLCTIQAELGEGAKPLGCTRFPFLLVQTPEGPVVGASFCCPAIQANQGRPLEEWEPWLQENLQGEGAPAVGLHPVEAGQGRSLDWAEYLDLERRLLEDVRSPEVARALFRRLQAFCRWLQGGKGDHEDLDPGLLVLRPYLLATLVGTVEAPTPREAPAFSQAFLFQDRIALTRFGWEGDPGFLLEHLDDPGPDVLEQEISRYLEALLFRHWPAQDRPLVSNLLLLSLVPWLARCYARAAAESRGASLPALEDAHRALAWIELRLVTHASGLEPLLESLTSSLLRQAAPQAPPVGSQRASRSWHLPRVAAAGVAVLLGLATLFVPAARPASASVALVVEEPAGRGDDPSLRQVLHAHQGAATFLLECEDLRDPRVVEDLARDGDQVGAVLHRGTSEAVLDDLRSTLQRSEKLDLQVVQVETDGTATVLVRRGFQVLRQPPVHLGNAEQVARLADSLGDGGVVVVEGGQTAELLVCELAGRGIRVTTLAHRGTQAASQAH